MQGELLSTDAYYLLNADGGMINTGQRRHEDPPGEAAVAVVLSQIRIAGSTLSMDFREQ